MKQIIGIILSFLILINQFVPVKAEQTTVNTSDPSKWQIDKNVSSENLNSVSCFKNKLFITVGANGTIRTSSDGLTWLTNENILYNCSNELNDIVCTNDQIIVVGDKGTILRSTDGTDWSIIKPISSNSIKKIIYGKNIFIAFTDKNGETLTSKDGINWILGKISSKQQISDVVWNGKVFVTVGGSGEICTSINGLVWQVKLLKNKPNLAKIVWNGKMFVTFGTTDVITNNYIYTSGQYIATSKDGFSWSIKTIKTKFIQKDSEEIDICGCQNIIWNGKSFVIILFEQTGYAPINDGDIITYISNNGLDWKRNTTNLGCNSIITVWTGSELIAACNYWARPGYYYGQTIYISKDGINWDTVLNENKDGSKASDIIFNNGRTIIVGDLGEISSSTDGLNWDKADSIHLPLLWNGKKFISVGVFGGDTDNIYSSNDGLSWKKENKIKGDVWVDNLTWSGQEYITFDNTSISTSKDLIKWDKTKFKDTDKIYNDIGSIRALATDGSLYLLAGEKGTAISKDKKNWVSRKAANFYKTIIIGKDNFVALNFYGQIDKSIDGLTWKRVKLKDSDGSINKIIYVGNQFIGVGSNGAILYSKDGSTWVKADSTVNKTLVDVCWTGKEFIAIGENVIVTSEDGLKWHQEVPPVNFYLAYISSSHLRFMCANSEIAIIYCNGKYLYKSMK